MPLRKFRYLQVHGEAKLTRVAGVAPTLECERLSNPYRIGAFFGARFSFLDPFCARELVSIRSELMLLYSALNLKPPPLIRSSLTWAPPLKLALNARKVPSARRQVFNREKDYDAEQE